ncbi:site-specific integrase [Tomitella fengzijianii]|uniref:Site-specific integrase n=1 Tax=Tomitella fengzijianii TaxID=2597660 RepID=A0A516X4W2_9ACTN|nr:site-specific integrase [Tomitella fengzijianii]QDQ98115.1 site-specific integrase [Tomitella fengzijianii]
MATISSYTTKAGLRYRVRYRTPDRRQTDKRGFRTKRQAEDFAATVEVAKLTGEYVDPKAGRATVGELAEQWIAGKVNLKPSSLARYRHSLDQQVLPRWESERISDVTTAGVQAWIAGMNDKGLSASTVRKAHHVLGLVCKMAIRDRRIVRNPCEGVDLPRLPKPDNRYLTAQQVADLAHAAGDNRLIILVLAYTGIRWSEMVALRVRRVDLKRRRLRIAEAATEVDGRLVWGTPKSHASRTVPYPAFLHELLREQIRGRGADELVFTTDKDGPVRSRAARRTWFDAAAEEAGVKGISPHDLRHAAASLAVSAGASIKGVQAMLGHSTAALTLDVYADLFEDDLDGVAQRLDAIGTGVRPRLKSV